MRARMHYLWWHRVTALSDASGPWHLAPETEIDHTPGGEPEDLGQPAGELPDPIQ